MAVCTLFSIMIGANPTPTPTMPVQTLGFGYAFGDDMVLQQAPSKAAIYGFAPLGAKSVTVSVQSEGKNRSHTLVL